MYKCAVLTISDKGSLGLREDLSGPAIKEMLEGSAFNVTAYDIIPDEKPQIKAKLIELAAECNLILTTGGTGFSPRDVTPEATREVIEREAQGIAEAIRAYSMTITKKAMLSRAVCGIRGSCVILNLPGSPKAVKEALEYVLEPLEHGIDTLIGNASDCARK